MQQNTQSKCCKSVEDLIVVKDYNLVLKAAVACISRMLTLNIGG